MQLISFSKLADLSSAHCTFCSKNNILVEINTQRVKIVSENNSVGCHDAHEFPSLMKRGDLP